jgi:hypothetical protein
MENQPNVTPINRASSNFVQDTPSTKPNTKPNLVFLIVVSVLLSAVVFGVGGCYLGTKYIKTPSLIVQQGPESATPTISITQAAKPTTVPTTTEANNKTKVEQHAFIKSVKKKDDDYYLTIDSAQMYDGAKGECRSAEDTNLGLPACNPNGFLLVNTNTTTQSLKVDSSAIFNISGFTPLSEKNLNSKQNLTVEEFAQIFSSNTIPESGLKDSLFIVETTENVVTHVRVQYLP